MAPVSAARGLMRNWQDLEVFTGCDETGSGRGERGQQVPGCCAHHRALILSLQHPTSVLSCRNPMLAGWSLYFPLSQPFPLLPNICAFCCRNGTRTDCSPFVFHLHPPPHPFLFSFFLCVPFFLSFFLTFFFFFFF